MIDAAGHDGRATVTMKIDRPDKQVGDPVRIMGIALYGTGLVGGYHDDILWLVELDHSLYVL